MESVEKIHADIIFQDYLKVFEHYKDANTETTRRYGVMSGDRIRTLPRSVLHIPGMDIELEDADYLKEEKLTVSGGLNNIDERFPNLQVLAIEVGDKTITDVFKTGIIKVEPVAQFGVKVGIRVIDGDGDMHLYSTVGGASTVNSEKLALATQEQNKTGAVEQRVLIRKKYEEITSNQFSDLRTAKTKLDRIIQNHIDNGGEKVIDWNTDFGDSVFYEKNGEIWIDTKDRGKGDFDGDNEIFLKTSELTGKDIKKYIELLNTNTELLFGNSIEQIEKNQKSIKIERKKAEAKKLAAEKAAEAKGESKQQQSIDTQISPEQNMVLKILKEYENEKYDTNHDKYEAKSEIKGNAFDCMSLVHHISKHNNLFPRYKKFMHNTSGTKKNFQEYFNRGQNTITQKTNEPLHLDPNSTYLIGLNTSHGGVVTTDKNGVATFTHSSSENQKVESVNLESYLKKKTQFTTLQIEKQNIGTSEQKQDTKSQITKTQQEIKEYKEKIKDTKQKISTKNAEIETLDEEIQTVNVKIEKVEQLQTNLDKIETQIKQAEET